MTSGPAEGTTPVDRFAFDLIRATEAAAMRAAPFVGSGDKNAADQAAVDAMRGVLASVDFAGVVVIGEGEKDRAPMLFNGESVGTGNGPACDIAVDPIDGTSLVSAGRDGAIAMIAIAERGTMLDASSVFYMDKLVCGREGRGVIDIRRPIGDNIRALAAVEGKPLSEMVIAVLDKPRHARLIDDIRAAGARTRLLQEGDVAAAIYAALPETSVDICIGIGGSPEGVATACAIKALGGVLQARLSPQSDGERETGLAAGLDFDRIWDADSLVASTGAVFVATGITDGDLVSGVRRTGSGTRTESIVLVSPAGTVHRIETVHPLPA